MKATSYGVSYGRPRAFPDRIAGGHCHHRHPGGAYTLINTVNVNESSDLDMNVTPGTTYYYVMTPECHDNATGTTYTRLRSGAGHGALFQ